MHEIFKHGILNANVLRAVCCALDSRTGPIMLRALWVNKAAIRRRNSWKLGFGNCIVPIYGLVPIYSASRVGFGEQYTGL
jgi:hypothetical protein